MVWCVELCRRRVFQIASRMSCGAGSGAVVRDHGGLPWSVNGAGGTVPGLWDADSSWKGLEEEAPRT